MDRYNWTEIPEEILNERVGRKMVNTEALTIARIRLSRGAIVPLHSHVNEQVSMVESGVLRFEMGGTEHILRAGDVLAIPPNLPHLVEALEDSTAIDVFTPRREDWITGDDSYLRR